MNIQSPNTIHVDHVMWQPFIACTKKCKGCYVQLADTEREVPLDNQILRLIQSGKVECEQLTISLNSFIMPTDITKALAVTLIDFWCWCNQAGNAAPDICLTLKDSTALLKWQAIMGHPTSKDFWGPVLMLSLSNMPSLGKKAMALKNMCNEHGVLLNYNKLVTEVHTDKATEIGCRYSDQTYLVLRKPPLGSEQNIEDLTNWLGSLTPVGNHIKENLFPDRCCTASRNFHNTGEHCTAGIDMVHVWPSGRVTACPYDSRNICSNQEKTEHNVWEELLEIRDQKRPHPMTKCCIPEAFQKMQKVAIESNKMVAPQEEQR